MRVGGFHDVPGEDGAVGAVAHDGVQRLRHVLGRGLGDPFPPVDLDVGYLTWNGGDPSRAYVEDVPRHARLRKGDWMETSGYSSIFPHGVSVGTIEKIYNSPDGLSYRLLVHLSTDFANLRDVCIINDKNMAERMRLKEAANDSLMLMPVKK